MGVYNNKNNLGCSITDKNFVMRVITLILAAVTAVVIFVKPQGAAAAQKKSKQAEGGVNMSLKNGVLTVKGKGAMWDIRIKIVFTVKFAVLVDLAVCSQTYCHGIFYNLFI